MRIIYLPDGPQGEKIGLDDFFVLGGTVEELYSHATPELRPLPASADDPLYVATENGLIWNRATADGPKPTRLCNFTARIMGERLLTDGAETTREYEIEVRHNEREIRFSVPAKTFDGLEWVAQHLPSGAFITPGRSHREHLTVAVRQLSGEVELRRVFAHTGWVRLDDDRPAYLHGGGALTATGDEPVDVELPAPLEPMRLVPPTSEAELVLAVRAALALWDAASCEQGVIVCLAVYRSFLGEALFTLFIVGPTGVFKTELAALAQRHFGTRFRASPPPASWSSTDNSLEVLAFYARHMALLVDDFAPQGNSRQQQALHARAERLLRAQGNGSGRGRLRADGTPRPVQPPRGLLLSTGEDVPSGHSVRARTLIIEVERGDIDAARLSRCQADADAGLYTKAAWGYARFLASQYDEIDDRIRRAVERERAHGAKSATHARLPDIIGQLMVGAELFLEFARTIGAITRDEELARIERARAALMAAAAGQGQMQREAEPTAIFIELLRAALVSGRAHVAHPSGGTPDRAGAWGWRCGEGMDVLTWRPQGERIGYVEGDDLYLVPQVAYRVAQIVGGEGGGLVVSVPTLNKRLAETGLLRTRDTTRGTFTVRRTLEEARRDVLHLNAHLLAPHAETPDQPDQEFAAKPIQDSRSGQVGQVETGGEAADTSKDARDIARLFDEGAFAGAECHGLAPHPNGALGYGHD